MSNYIVGTWQLVPSDGFWKDQNTKESENFLGQAVRMGNTSFDTAQSYGKGRTEQLLGKVLTRFPFCDFKVDTKIMPSSKDPLELIKQSLARLKNNSINRLYLHWPRTGFHAIDFIAKMAKAKELGLIEKVGVCNTPVEYLKEVLTGLKALDCKINSLQIPVSLLWTRDLEETLALCKEQEIEILAYSPMGMGLLSGKYRKSSDLLDARANLFCFEETCQTAFEGLLATLHEIASLHDKPCSQIALAWTAMCGVDTIILGARNIEQLKTDISALAFKLDSGEFVELKKASNRLAQCSKNVCNNIFSYNW